MSQEKIITTGRSCTGCFACMNACPVDAVTVDKSSGFYRLYRDTERCISCEKCSRVCPQNAELQEADKTESVAFAAINRATDVRMTSSSGGVFSLFAREVIRAGGVVYGTVFDEHTHVRLARAETEAEILPMRGSKYAQSEVGMGYRRVREDLEAGREVLFSGVPCQCVALHAFLGKSYDRLTVIEVLCHGAPSPVVWENYVAYRMQQAGTDAYPTDIDMRKKEGIAGACWGKECFSMAFPDRDAYVRMNRKDPFMVLSFRADAILNESCYDCRYRGSTVRPWADVTLSDFWGVDSCVPHFRRDEKGVSLVVLQSDRGRKIWETVRDDMETAPAPVEKSLRANGAFRNPPRKYLDKNRKLVLRLCGRPEKFGRVFRRFLPVFYIRKIKSKLLKR